MSYIIGLAILFVPVIVVQLAVKIDNARKEWRR